MGKVDSTALEPSYGGVKVLNEKTVSYVGSIPKGKYNNITDEFVIEGKVNVSSFIYAGIYTGTRRLE